MHHTCNISRKVYTNVILLLICLLVASQANCTKADVPVFDPTAYYAGTQSFTGLELRQSLHERIFKHQRYTYKCVWEILSETYQDPNRANHVVGFYGQSSSP